MRILMVHSFHHNRGGDTTYTQHLTHLLGSKGHEVYPFAMNHPENYPAISQRYFSQWTRLSQGRKQGVGDILSLIWSRSAQKDMSDILDHFKPDIVHIQHLHRHLTPSILRPIRNRKIPIVWTLHDYELICPNGKLFKNNELCTKCVKGTVFNSIRYRCKWGKLAPSILSAVEHGVHRLMNIQNWVDTFISPSSYLSERLIESGVRRENVQVLQNPINCPAYQPPSKKQWLIAGRLSPEKGFHTAIDAAKLTPTFPLLICGDGPDKERLMARAGSAKNIHFLGMLPHKRVQDLIQDSMVIAVPSLWPENYPYAVLEGQANGRAVIASPVGGISEQIQHERTGILVTPNEPETLAEWVVKLLNDPRKTNQIGLKAREQTLISANPNTHLSKIEELYSSLIST